MLTKAHYLIGLAAVTLFWSSYGTYVYQTARLSDILRTPTRPLLLNGLPLRFDDVSQRRIRELGNRSRYLVFVSSDRCQYSGEEAKRWAHLLESLKFGLLDAVIFLSMDGTVIPDELTRIAEAHGVRTATIPVENPAEFAEVNGIAWTPATLLLDGQLAIRLASPALAPTVVELLHEGFREHRVSNAGVIVNEIDAMSTAR